MSAGGLSEVEAGAAGATPELAYAIAHMVNTKEAVSWALGKGANAVEMDLVFNGEAPDRFEHSPGGNVCDCSTCYVACGLGVTNCPEQSCGQVAPSNMLDIAPCTRSTPAAEMFEFLAGARAAAMVYVDTKTKTISGSLDQAGQNLAKMLTERLFGKGYTGFVIVNGETLDKYNYLAGVAAAVRSSPYEGRVFYTIDFESSNSAEVLRALVRLSKYRVYSVGISPCLPGTYYEQVVQGAWNFDNGVLSMPPVAWTVDSQSTMDDYRNAGSRAIMSNYPGRARGALPPLASPGQFPPASRSDQVLLSPSCDCNYHSGGCAISAAAPVGLACRCKYMGAWTCKGSAVRCASSEAPACRAPDKSALSCIQGGGDCGGYDASSGCDCDYKRGGCIISKVAPKYSACKCKYKGFYTCGGEVVRCTNEGAAECVSPSSSKASCTLGGGDCGGY